MKYHKIRGVEKSVCTAEQKIAYNIAFRIHINHGDEFCALPTAAAKAEAASSLIHMYIGFFREDQERKNSKRFDIDAIFSALNAGLSDYLENHFIACDYASIGMAFPAHYLEA